MPLTDLFKKLTGKADAPPEEDPTDGRLVDLFQKYKLLKKTSDKTLAELNTTREELAALRNQAEEMGKRLMALDDFLADPEKGQSVIVHYQLAQLWSRCNGMVAERAYELSQKHEAEEKQQLLVEFANAQRQKLAAAEDKLRFAQAQLDEVSLRKRQLETDLAASQRFWHYFKRKRLVGELENIDATLKPVANRHKELSEEVEGIKQAPTPEYKGLSLQAKRAINLHLIALAQYLYQALMLNQVAQHAQNTHGQQPNSSVYGDTKTCLQMVVHISEGNSRLNNDAERQLKLSQRYAHLQEKARYASGTDAVPERELYAAIDGAIGAGTREVKAFDLEGGRMLVNVVDGDYFGLKSMLLQ
jgi:hypothetical protein